MITRRIDPYFLAGAAAGVAVLITYAIWSLLHQQKRPTKPELWPSGISDAATTVGLTHTYGPRTAPYVLREISDFRCAGCATAETTIVRGVKVLADAGVLRLVVYDLPGPENAVGAIVAATCVASIDPSKYWPYRAAIYANRNGWMHTYPPESFLVNLATPLSLDSLVLKQCVNDRGSTIAANADMLATTVGRSGIYSTPTWSLQDSVFTTEQVSDRVGKLLKTHQLLRPPAAR